MGVRLKYIPKAGGAIALTITNGSSRRVQLLQEPGVGALFYFEATVDTYIRQGDDTVTAGTGDMFVPAGTKIDIRADDGDNNFLALRRLVAPASTASRPPTATPTCSCPIRPPLWV
jgi:hypothetical protein